MAVSYTATIATVDYGFDFDEQFIYTPATLDQIGIENLYSAIKEAQASEVGVVYEQIADGSGLDELDPGVSTFLTIRVFDEWEIRSLKSSGKVTTNGGNIVKDNGKDPFYDDGAIFYIAFFSQAGIKTTVATGSGLNAAQEAELFKNTAILADTNELQTDWADGGRLDVILDGKSTQVSVSSLPNATDNADALLVRNLAGGSNGGRTIQDALRGNRNRVVIDSTAGTITVYEEDDTTVAWTGVAAFEARNAISSVDPS